MKKFFKFLYKKIVAGGVMGIAFVLCAGAVLAFTEPTSGPSITEPASADSTGQIETLLGTPQSALAGTDTIFGYLRTVYTSIGKTPSSVAPNASDAGKLVDLVGTSATVADGKTLFNFLKNINDNLDFPETASVLSSDTVKNVSGSISNCSTPGAQSCYAAGTYYASTACAGQGSQSCYAAGTYYASTACSTPGAQSCYATGTYYASTACASQGSQSCYATGSYYGYTRVDADGDSAYTITSGDCDDTCATCYPGSTSYTTSADGNDQDCNGVVDDDVPVIIVLDNSCETYPGDCGTCTSVCSTIGASCLGIGTDSSATNGYYYWSNQYIEPYCRLDVGHCGLNMHYNGYPYIISCEGKNAYWTNCRCSQSRYH